MAKPHGRVVVGPILAVQNNNLLKAKAHMNNSSSARASQGTPLNSNDIPVLIQEVIQLLMRRSFPGHSEQLFMENTSDQPIPASDMVPSTPLANNTLPIEDVPDLVQQIR